MEYLERLTVNTYNYMSVFPTKLTHLFVSLIDGMYSKTLTVSQWLSSRKMPRKPDEGGVGRRGQAVTDWSQDHRDHRHSGTHHNVRMS